MSGFEPKQKVELDPPKDDVISQEYLSKCNGRSRLLHPIATTVDNLCRV